MTPPCKGCTRRTDNCHSHCEQYVKYKVEVKAETESRRRERTWGTQWVDHLKANRAWSSGRTRR